MSLYNEDEKKEMGLQNSSKVYVDRISQLLGESVLKIYSKIYMKSIGFEPITFGSGIQRASDCANPSYS